MISYIQLTNFNIKFQLSEISALDESTFCGSYVDLPIDPAVQ